MAKIIDLFCGAGGFSLGSHYAGFKTALAIDIDHTLTSSYEINFRRSKLMLADISKLSGKEVLQSADIGWRSPFGIVGGPPCQGFSFIGKRERGDPRNRLVWHFFRIVKEAQPQFFVMENVPGILSGAGEALLSDSLELVSKYEVVGPLLVEASDFGAATERQRVVVIGYKKNTIGPLSEADLENEKVPRKGNVRDAISDLPGPRGNAQWVSYRKQRNQCSEYAQRARFIPGTELGCPQRKARIAGGEVDGIASTNHSRDVIFRFRKIEQGKTDPISRCPRLAWDKTAPTLRAGTGPERGSFQSIRPLHPVSPRVITPREAARLQGFPDWFMLHSTKWHSFRMIGNSVSPYVSRSVISIVAKKCSE